MNKGATKRCERYMKELSNVTNRRYLLSVGYNNITLRDQVTQNVVISALNPNEFSVKSLLLISEAEDKVSENVILPPSFSYS